MLKVTVIIPVYNVENYVSSALDSIINQTLSDIEIIVINDGSTDRTRDIIESYVEKYNNITLINQENQGSGIARNQGLSRAKGKYIYFFDGDDILEKDTLEICFKECESGHLDMVCFDAEIFEEDDYEGTYNDFIMRKHLLESKVKKGEELLVEAISKNCFRTESWMNFYSRKFLNKYKILYSEQRIYEDVYQVINAFLHARKVKFIPYTFLYRRLRNNSSMTTSRGILNIDCYFKEAMNVYEMYENYRNISDETKCMLIKLSKYYIMRSISVCDEISDINYKNEVISRIPKELYDINIDIQLSSANLFYERIGIKVNY